MHLRAVWLAVILLEKNMNMKTIEDVLFTCFQIPTAQKNN
ncbi:hypothetical protein AB46_1345 [Escherichia coli 3-267-03_S1_C2]|nr:hypothetical protein AB46_1345 [Escherichia coli 3-267-03_S1_C2]